MRNLYFLLLLFVLGCSSEEKVVVEDLQAFDGEAINVVVEIPAGTNHKIEYNYANASFENDQIDGKDRIIQFLPYPGNYGFIPGTLMDKERGGDGDALDILVIGEAVPTGSLVQVKAIGALMLKDKGEIDTKIVAVPLQNSPVQVDGFIDFALKYDAARRIIEDWFLNYKGAGVMELMRWEDENYALSEIRKWQKK